MKSTVTPSVTDPMFGIRVPLFLVVYGHVIHNIAVDLQHTRVLDPGKVIQYKRHGMFELEYAGEDFGVIKHTTTSGHIQYLYIPQRKWLAVSNGSYRSDDLNYDSALRCWAYLRDRPKQSRSDTSPAGTASSDLIEKYQLLLDAYRDYWSRNFANLSQHSEDTGAFELETRIRYGLVCAGNNQPVPPDCDYTSLIKEFDGWISYREKLNN